MIWSPRPAVPETRNFAALQTGVAEGVAGTKSKKSNFTTAPLNRSSAADRALIGEGVERVRHRRVTPTVPGEAGGWLRQVPGLDVCSCWRQRRTVLTDQPTEEQIEVAGLKTPLLLEYRSTPGLVARAPGVNKLFPF